MQVVPDIWRLAAAEQDVQAVLTLLVHLKHVLWQGEQIKVLGAAS